MSKRYKRNFDGVRQILIVAMSLTALAGCVGNGFEGRTTNPSAKTKIPGSYTTALPAKKTSAQDSWSYVSTKYSSRFGCSNLAPTSPGCTAQAMASCQDAGFSSSSQILEANESEFTFYCVE